MADGAILDPATRRRRPLVGAALLVGAAVIWGFAFIPQKLTVVDLPPFTATAVRFCLAAPLAVLLAIAAGSGKRLLSPGVSGGSAVLLGVLLFAIYTLQTAGLVYAPVARVSLITGMYAIFVPFFAPFLGHARPAGAHWLAALLAFAGLLGLVGVVGGEGLGAPLSVPFNIGDVLVLLHALGSAFQVLLVGRLARDADPFALNAVQVTTVMVLAVPAALVFDGVPALRAVAELDPRTLMAFLYLAALSTVVGFTCQLMGQRHTSAPTAAVLMLLETPVGVLGALLFLDERMGLSQWVGAVVLVVGVLVSLVPELRRSAAAATP